jgi:hypothetical protein
MGAIGSWQLAIGIEVKADFARPPILRSTEWEAGIDRNHPAPYSYHSR